MGRLGWQQYHTQVTAQQPLLSTQLLVQTCTVLHNQIKDTPTLVLQSSSRANFLITPFYLAFIHFVEYLRDHSLCSFETNSAGTDVLLFT